MFEGFPLLCFWTIFINTTRISHNNIWINYVTATLSPVKSPVPFFAQKMDRDQDKMIYKFIQSNFDRYCFTFRTKSPRNEKGRRKYKGNWFIKILLLHNKVLGSFSRVLFSNARHRLQYIRSSIIFKTNLMRFLQWITTQYAGSFHGEFRAYENENINRTVWIFNGNFVTKIWQK